MITIHELAVHRGAKPDEPGGSSFNGGEYVRVGLPFMGGCGGCGANLGAYNAYPSKAGTLRCHDCIGDGGYLTVQEANEAIFDVKIDAESEAAIARLKRELNAVEVE